MSDARHLSRILLYPANPFSQVHVFAARCRARERLPFPLLGVDSDDGSDFINHQVYRYSQQEKLTFTRGQVGKKSDTAFAKPTKPTSPPGTPAGPGGRSWSVLDAPVRTA